MDKQTYPQLVQAIAEEMAKDFFGPVFNGFPESEKQQDVADYMGAARIAVKHMAHAYELCFARRVENAQEADWQSCNEEMKEQGLMPGI